MRKSNLPMPALSDNDIARFHSKYRMLSPGGCWESIRGRKRDGRGVLEIGRHRYLSSRIAYFLFTGEDPGELQVQHTCNNPACVCPLHLVLGTHKSNSEYMIKCRRNYHVTHPEKVARGERHGTKTHPESVARGDRHGLRIHPESRATGSRNGSHTKPERRASGGRNGSAKLNDDSVLEILILYRSGKYTQESLAQRFGIGQSRISDIVLGKRWSHVFLKFTSLKTDGG